MRHRLSTLGCLLLGACGPLHDADYRGEPLFSISGKVESTGEMEWLLGPKSHDVPVMVGFFWARAGEAWLEQELELTTEFPARYELQLFEPPPEEAMLDVRWARSGPIALGLPLLFLDDDGDGRRSDDEPLVGNAQGIHVLYASASGRVGPRQQSFWVDEGFQRVFSSDTTCDVKGAPNDLSPIPKKSPTNLLIGPAFTDLIDIDCDGNPDDWNACPTGEYLLQWCYQATVYGIGHPCLEACASAWW